MKDRYRGVAKSPLAPPEIDVKAPDPEYIFDVVASGRNEAPVIPESAPDFVDSSTHTFPLTEHTKGHSHWTNSIILARKITLLSTRNLIPQRVFESETKKQYKQPFAESPLASWSHGEEFYLAPFPPNPYQTNIAPFMYCSDYCHISQGTRPCTVIDQLTHDMRPHRTCKQRYVVSNE
ncbi:unnamed protein product, partial [Iphiclides podalirius]